MSATFWVHGNLVVTPFPVTEIDITFLGDILFFCTRTLLTQCSWDFVLSTICMETRATHRKTQVDPIISVYINFCSFRGFLAILMKPRSELELVVDRYSTSNDLIVFQHPSCPSITMNFHLLAHVHIFPTHSISRFLQVLSRSVAKMMFAKRWQKPLNSLS